MVGAASRSTVAISGWLVLLSGMATGEGGGLPSVSLVLRRGGAWGESSLILCYCYFWLHRRLIPARDPWHFLVCYRPLARLRSVQPLGGPSVALSSLSKAYG